MSEPAWTVAECAAAWGVKPSTWRDYVAKGYAPEPLPYYDEQRRRRWDPEQVRAALARRPGRGARTDLSSSTPTDKEH